MSRRLGLLAALAALSTVLPAAAQNVQLSLNLKYNDPADAAEGGTFQLVAKTDATFGLAGVNTFISSINTGDVAYGAGINADTLPGGLPFVIPGNPVNLLYFQNTSAPGVVLNIGKGSGTPGNQSNDPLKSAAWDNAALIATGSYGGTRPTFASSGSNVTDANVLSVGAPPFNMALDAVTTFKVRGDSLASAGLEAGGAGLLRGVANRDFVVTAVDLNRVLLNFNKTGQTWDNGDFTDGLGGHVEGTVDAADLNQVLLNFNKTSTPPSTAAAISAAPEPTGTLLAALGVVAYLGVRRKLA